MATHSSVASFAARIDGMGRIIARPTDRAMVDAGVVFGDIIDAAADRSGATSFAERPRPRYQARLRRSVVVIRPRNPGAVIALDSGTDPHVIGARGRGTRRMFRSLGAGSNEGRFTGTFDVGVGRRRRTVRGYGALRFEGNFAIYVRHPGMDGYGFIRKSREKATRRGAETYLRAKRRELMTGSATR